MEPDNRLSFDNNEEKENQTDKGNNDPNEVLYFSFNQEFK